MALILILVHWSCNRWIVGNVPIRYYGLVLDENGKGVEGANVELDIMVRAIDVPIMWGRSRTRSVKIDKTTRPDGTFDLSGIEGHQLSVTIGKQGYIVYEPHQADWIYPLVDVIDKEHPVCFRMRPFSSDGGKQRSRGKTKGSGVLDVISEKSKTPDPFDSSLGRNGLIGNSTSVHPRGTLFAIWDLRTSQRSAIINWPESGPTEHGSNWFQQDCPLKSIQILLPDRPPLTITDPMTVQVKRSGDRIIKIYIQAAPGGSQQQYLARLRDFAKEWNWRWEENFYQQWIRRVAEGNTSGISVGDQLTTELIEKEPYVGIGIQHYGVVNDSWYLDYDIEWREALPKPYGTAK